MQCMLYNYVHECLILTTMHVFGVVTLIFFLIVHQACWTRHFVWNPIGACDVTITSIRISVVAIGFSMTIVIIIILSNMFTCIRKYQFIKRMKMYSQTLLTPTLFLLQACKPAEYRGNQGLSFPTGEASCP